MEDNLFSKTSLTKTLNKLSFNSNFSMNVDSNANIKNILDVESYLYDLKAEAGSGKAVVSGKLGVKVLYIDTDNITNTLTDSQTINETLVDQSITADAYINVSNFTTVNSIVSGEGNLKVGCEVNVMPVMYINLAIPNNASNFENLIVKKSEINTLTLNSIIDSAFDYSVNFETKDAISKILMYNASFASEGAHAEQGKTVVEGKIYSTLIYETAGEESEIKELTDVFNLKTAVEANVDADDILDVNFVLDKSKETILTDNEEDGNIVTVGHKILMQGASFKTLTLDVVDDMFSCENEIEINRTKRDYCHTSNCTRVEESVSGEISIEESESAIDKVVSNLNITPEITNTYIKDGKIMVEGIISSCVVYLDENKEYKYKRAELPFIIDTKIKSEKLGCVHTTISVCDCRVKAKRGTIIELDYSVKICVCEFVVESRELLDNFTLGKPLDFGGFDYQIFIARAGESMWDLCKRIKVKPEDLAVTNPNLPLVMEGGEKVVIKR